MKVVLSPAMNMDNCINNDLEKTLPIFTDEARELVEMVREINPFDLEFELGISSKLSENVFKYYCSFDNIDFRDKGTQALVAFQGLAYKNIAPSDFTRDDFDFAKDRLRILSAMYGVLKPTDLIQQYRLDFMCDFAKKNDLYGYWGSKVYEELFKDNEIVVGICSKEYEKLIKPFLKSSDKYISCEFLINKNGKLKAQATASKMARGQMARYIIKNRIEDIEMLKAFDFDGFVYSEFNSNSRVLAFVR